ncbi:MAG: ABC transporter ATP-binding protein [Solobacterium sp.]|nr:ABC transporter ATP-binding protein [Solobacterium sp.]
MKELRVDNISKIYDKAEIIGNISFCVPEGSVFAIVGPSGSGKTTLLRLLCGLDHLSSGAIYYDDKDITSLPPKDRKFTMVFQDAALFPHLTVVDNITYGLKPLGYTDQLIDKKVKEYSELLSIQNLLERYPSSLSAGEKQRVGIARAFIREPELILLDEPFSNLDVLLKEELKKDLIAIHKKSKQTMIIVTHDQNEALNLADEIMVLNKGKLVELNSPQELYENPQNLFTAQFIGVPQMNLYLMKRTSPTSFSLLGEEFEVKKDLPESFYVGIRPEDIKVVKNGTSCGRIVDVRQFNDRYLIDAIYEEEMVSFYSETIGELNTEVYYHINKDKIHIFDVKTYKKIPIT